MKLFFNYIPYDLVLFFFRVKFKYSFFSNLHFLNYFCFLINFFKFISNFFIWLRILHCCFFMFVFYVVVRLHDICHRFWKLDWKASIIFYYVYKFYSLSLRSLQIGILCFFFVLYYFVNLIFLFNFSFQFNIWW